jgi:hypothetical protein
MQVDTKPKPVVKSGWVINPQTRSIEPHVFGGLSSLYYALDCQHVDCVETRDFDVWVDDEALMGRPKFFFAVKGYPEPLAGRGFVLGRNAEGGSITPSISKSELERRIMFLLRDDLGNILRVHADRDPTPITLIGIEQWAMTGKEKP